jgi:hypothetical protein
LIGGPMVTNRRGTTYGTTSYMGVDFSYSGAVASAYNFDSILTTYLPVYFKGTIGSDGLFYFYQGGGYTGWYTQSLPTTEDGFVYIYLGNVGSSTTSVVSSPVHPVYEFKNGQIRLYMNDNTHIDNFAEYFGTDNDASILYDGTNLVVDPDTTGTDTGLVYIDGNVSAVDFITRTSVYDKTKGDALDWIKDSSNLVDTKGKIDHSKFYGFTTFNVTDKSKPVIVKTPKEICKLDDKEKEVCITEFEETITYPFTKVEEGVNLVDEIEMLKQAVFELKNELCKKDSSYEWCKAIK